MKLHLDNLHVLTSHNYAYCCTQLMVEGIYILVLLDTDTSRRSDVMKKFTEVAIDHSDHLQPGYEYFRVCIMVVSFSTSLKPRYAAFYLSAFPNTTSYAIPQGILQGLKLLPLTSVCLSFFTQFCSGGLYDYPSAPDWDHYVDQSNNPMVRI